EQQAGEHVDRVVLHREAEDRAEHDLQHDHGEQRLQHRPQEADRRALVAHLELAGDERRHEVAVLEGAAEHGWRSREAAAGNEAGERGLYYARRSPASGGLATEATVAAALAASPASRTACATARARCARSPSRHESTRRSARRSAPPARRAAAARRAPRGPRRLAAQRTRSAQSSAMSCRG